VGGGGWVRSWVSWGWGENGVCGCGEGVGGSGVWWVSRVVVRGRPVCVWVKMVVEENSGRW